jgi:hypothetical protein
MLGMFPFSSTGMEIFFLEILDVTSMLDSFSYKYFTMMQSCGSGQKQKQFFSAYFDRGKSFFLII